MMAGGDMAAALYEGEAESRFADDVGNPMATGRGGKQKCDYSAWLRGVDMSSSLRRHADPTTD